jgi:prephenate dehydrogenase
MERRATIVGAGLIGGSVGMALRKQGWHTSIVDLDAESASEALHVGAADEIGFDERSELTVVAAPVSAIPELIEDALLRTGGIVTDVGSTKAELCGAVTDPRFVGGHPMAGSEQDGIGGARDDLFAGSMWVLTPTETTSEEAFASVRAVVRSLGAESIALPPAVHDELVAQVTHVPHLTAVTLMNLADTSSIEHRALLRLAAGGFRDMTRISAGHPSIWPDICVANSRAIVEGMDRLIEALSTMRRLVADHDTAGILDLLSKARAARINLPVSVGPADNPVELAIPIPDRPGEIAAIATLAAELDVNIYDLEISHSVEGRQGVMVTIVDEERSERFIGGLLARGYRPTVRSLE